MADSDDSVIILGDFNMSDALWASSVNTRSVSCTNHSNVSRITSYFLEIACYNQLQQHNTLPTCNNKPLDLVFTNDLPVSVFYADKPVSSNHEALEIHVALRRRHNIRNACRSTYNFKKTNFDIVRRLLSSFCWSQLLCAVSANEALSIFYNILFAVLTDCVPVVKISNRKFPYWYNKELIALVKEKERARKAFVIGGRNKDSHEYLIFRTLRSDVKSMQQACHNDYLKQVSENIRQNPKRFWSYVKSLKGSDIIPSVMTYNNCEFTSLRDITAAFCRYFESVFLVNSNIVLPECRMFDVPLFRLPHVSPEEMKTVILSLNKYTCSGYDNVPAVLLLECADVLCFPLSIIFNQSVQQGEYPALLKKNNVIPIFKPKGDKSSVESYRPISIQPIVSKLFESLVNRALRNHLSQLICVEQHGFCPNKSTTTNLLCYKDFISSALDDGVQVHSVYTDFHKAFDTVSHELLLLKMNMHFGISGKELDWFRSYLSHRFQRVVIAGVESDWVSVTSGVPQGSILGPSLFIMFINDLPSYFRSSECLLFADDLKIYQRVSSLSDCANLQSDLNQLSNWCSTWRMKLNLVKCCVVNFSLKRKLNISFDYVLNGSTLKSVSDVKDLGVYFSSNLCFSLHITTVVNKAFRMLGFLKRTMKPFKNVNVMKILFNAYVRSCLDYCSPVWSPHAKYLIDKVERVQQRFVKHLCFVSQTPFSSQEYPSLCKHFKLTTLVHRRRVTDLFLFHKIIHAKVNCPYLLSSIYFNLPIRRTRHSGVLSILKKCRLQIRKFDFFPRTVELVNSCPQLDFFDRSLSKSTISDSLI